jgi:hypothetical protein
VTGADLQWWHFVAALATMLVFVVVCAWQSAAWQAERDRLLFEQFGRRPWAADRGSCE